MGINSYDGTCFSTSRDYFNLHLNFTEKLQPQFAQLLQYPEAAVNKVLDIWNSFDPKVCGCFQSYRIPERIKVWDWSARVWDWSESVFDDNAIFGYKQICISERKGFCFTDEVKWNGENYTKVDQFEVLQKIQDCLTSAYNRFEECFKEEAGSRSIAFKLVDVITKTPWTPIIGSVAALTCFSKAYQWHSEAQNPEKHSWITPQAKRNIAIAAGLISTIISAKNLF